jgi:hypothetical protein
VIEAAQRGTEARVEPELVDELTEAHERNEDGKVGRVEADTTGFVLPVSVSTLDCPYRHDMGR